MKKGIKTAGIVALSSVLACGALGALAGCNNGGGNPRGDENTLTVSIFCNAADATTNQNICNTWAADYSKTHADELGGKQIKVDLRSDTNTDNYYKALDNEWSTDSTSDIIYLAPRYVKSYVENGNILDLSEYLTDSKELISDVWQNGISYYGYIKGQSTSYKMGRSIEVNDAGKFVTADGADKGTEVGLYGLPKDYSNFSTGYNRLFFSEALKTAYTSTKPTATVSTPVNGPKGEGTGNGDFSAQRRYTHGTQDKCVIDPVTNEATNIINIGKPTTYKPYNFFRFNNYNAALAGNDPVAIMSEAMGGYTVTIPGFPNDRLSVDGDDFDVVYGEDTVSFESIDVPYNKNIAHVTYTYAEYGALLWAVTYYLNTFAWDHPENNTGGKMFTTANGAEYQTIYGGEQYEGTAGATGSVLYLLPWLASNDADLINDLSTLTSQGLTSTAIANPADWKSVAGTKTYSTSKRTLADTLATKNVQYGHDSQNFIETYAAFLAIGSDWNVNPSGDTDSVDRANNGWAYFRSGRSICYGAGSWDAATRNDVQPEVLDFGQMPTPIAEKYALYSEIKDANYQKAVYANDPAAAAPGSADEGKQLTGAALTTAKTKTYTADEILHNQIRRQDKWAARMDTVGYAVASKVASYTGGHAWKKDAAVDLVRRLTINKDAQKTLLYAGAQFPNFVSQCEDFVNYKTAGADGAFADMLTPEGFADTPANEATALWNKYYELAKDMEEKAKANSTQTVDQYMAQQTIVPNAKYDQENYGSVTFAQFTGEGNARLSYAMKVLRMVTFREDDRDINIRMQYGLNAVRDSSMYTYDNRWMSAIDARSNITNMLAYSVKKPIDENVALNFLVSSGNNYTSNYIQMNPAQASAPSGSAWSYMTPAVWCLTKAPAAQSLLVLAITDELATLVGR